MTAKEEFVKSATKINTRKANEAAVINAAISETRLDFAQYHGLALVTADPITGTATEYSTLDIDTAAYNGTTLNAIDISLDGGTTDHIAVLGASSVRLNNVRITSAVAIQAKNLIGGSNYTGLYVNIW